MIIHLADTGAANRKILTAILAKRFPGAAFKPAAGGLRVSGLPPGKAADAAPLIENMPGVATVSFSDAELCPLALAKTARPFASPLDFRKKPVFIAGPCAVEDEASYLSSARALKACGAHALRAALFKPRSSPYAFQGLGWAGLGIIAKAKNITGLPLATEATDTRQVERLAEVCDIIQIGARNMRNYELLKEAARSGRAVLLKRGMRATLREWLLSAEYLLKYGAKKLILCERGDSVFPAGGPWLDLRLMRAAKKLTGLPMLADPSHAAGDRELAAVLAVKALSSGADGLLIEASVNPFRALVDGRQTVTVETFRSLAGKCRSSL
ncbi:MAG TPA: 3-deoxy-7-phosphoheptulonate synthase [Elusimicrobia bacterium]|nr:3-deoxy-7-phosphoheptulonate synthase [Elusimicrobiota bacterium]